MGPSNVLDPSAKSVVLGTRVRGRGYPQGYIWKM